MTLFFICLKMLIKINENMDGGKLMNQTLWYNQSFINRRSNAPTKIGNYIIFLIPILNLASIKLGGQLLVGETILLFMLPVLILKRSGLRLDKNILIIVVFLLLWLISQIVSDIINQTVFIDYIRGWANIGFFLTSLLTLSLLLRTPLRIFLFLSGLSISLLVQPFILFTNETFFVLWKFGMGTAVLLLLCLPYLWKMFKNPFNITPLKNIIFIHFFIGLISFFLNARSFGGITFLTGLLLYVFYKKRGKRVKTLKIIFTLVLGLTISIGMVQLYITGSKSGFLGEESQSKYELQLGNKDADFLSVLLSGRTEILVSTVAIADSPIIGHGSWAKDFKYTLMLLQLKSEFNDTETREIRAEEQGLIPSHSYLFGSWVYAGVFGALFWISILYMLIFKIFPKAFSQPSPLSVIFLMGFLNILWNIFFSPFGANSRLVVAFYIVAYFTLLKKGYCKTYE